VLVTYLPTSPYLTLPYQVPSRQSHFLWGDLHRSSLAVKRHQIKSSMSPNPSSPRQRKQSDKNARACASPPSRPTSSCLTPHTALMPSVCLTLHRHPLAIRRVPVGYEQLPPPGPVPWTQTTQSSASPNRVTTSFITTVGGSKESHEYTGSTMLAACPTLFVNLSNPKTPFPPIAPLKLVNISCVLSLRGPVALLVHSR